MSVSIYFLDKDEKPVRLPFERVNMSNFNAEFFLSALGFSPEQEEFQDIPAQEFIQACTLFLNSGLPALIDHGRTEPEQLVNVTFIPPREGYLVTRARECMDQTQIALELGCAWVCFH